MSDVIRAVILGIVEGVTEFLPVSSTGHLLLAERFFDLGEGEFWKSFAILIQLGAILAIVALYFAKLWRVALGMFTNPDDRRLYSLHLTKNGGELLEKIGKVAREPQEALLTALSREERNELITLLLRIADQQGLVRGVHPGYQRMGSPRRSEANDAPSHGPTAGPRRGR